MSEAQLTPNLRAGGDINPYRVVICSTSADNTGIEANATDAFPLGIADGSTKQFDSTLHAESGDPISLQTGLVMIAEAGEAITRGSKVATGATGKLEAADAAAAGDYNVGVALESASGDGALIRIYYMPHANY